MARTWLVKLGEHEPARIVMHDSRVMFHRTNKAFFIGYFLSFVQHISGGDNFTKPVTNHNPTMRLPKKLDFTTKL
jgi:hypothetical protein